MNSARWRAAGFLTEDSSGDPFFLPGGTPKEETLCQLVSGFFEKVFLADPTAPYAVQQHLWYMCCPMSIAEDFKRFVCAGVSAPVGRG